MGDFGSLVSIDDRALVFGAAGTVLAYMGGVLLLERSAGRVTRLLALVLLAGAVNMIANGARRALYHPLGCLTASTFGGFSLSAITFLTTLFAYHFLEDDRPRERRIVTWIYVAVLAPAVAPYALAPIFGTPEYSPAVNVFTLNIRGTFAATCLSWLPWNYVTFALFGTYAWAAVVFLRKAVRFERSAQGGSMGRALLAPRSRRARSARDFGALTFGLIGVQVAVLFGSFATSNILALFASCACVWVHVNHSSEPTRLRFKLIAIPLAVVVGLQALLFYRITGSWLEAHRAGKWREVNHIRRLVEDGGATPALSPDQIRDDVRFVVSQPASDGAHSQQITPLFLRPGFDVGVLVESDRLQEEWHVNWTLNDRADPQPDLEEPERRRIIREQMRTGERTRWPRIANLSFYGHLLPREDHYTSIGWEQDGTVYRVGWSEADRRRQEGELGGKLMLVILATGLAIVLGLPTLYRASILRPLGALLGGVQRVAGGDLTEDVPVRTTDEIGVLAGSFNTMVGSVRDARERLERINAAAFRFVPRAFLKQLGHTTILSVELGDQTRRTMTVLFADVRDFTSLSEGMTPDETFAFVNDLLSRLGPVIRHHGGFIDKYIGDAIMALFDGSADEAVAAAIGMRDALAALNRERAGDGREPIRLGIGLHTGDLMLGIIGEEERIEGTVLSDAVNTASRVEGLTKQLGVEILASGETVAALTTPGDYEIRALDAVHVKGRERPVQLHEIVGPNGG